MWSLLIFCMGVGLCGFFVGAVLNFTAIGLIACMIANCLLFIFVAVGSVAAFAESLEATQIYPIEDNEPKVKLILKFGAYCYREYVSACKFCRDKCKYVITSCPLHTNWQDAGDIHMEVAA